MFLLLRLSRMQQGMDLRCDLEVLQGREAGVVTINVREKGEDVGLRKRRQERIQPAEGLC